MVERKDRRERLWLCFAQSEVSVINGRLLYVKSRWSRTSQSTICGEFWSVIEGNRPGFHGSFAGEGGGLRSRRGVVCLRKLCDG